MMAITRSLSLCRNIDLFEVKNSQFILKLNIINQQL